jgi:uncharacterized membrane protein YheB (UPF0754 family)
VLHLKLQTRFTPWIRKTKATITINIRNVFFKQQLKIDILATVKKFIGEHSTFNHFLRSTGYWVTTNSVEKKVQNLAKCYVDAYSIQYLNTLCLLLFFLYW